MIFKIHFISIMQLKMAQNAITIHIYNKTDGKHAVFVAT